MLMLAFVIVMDAVRLRDSALWGTRDWFLSAITGAVVAMIGVLAAVRAIYRQATGRADDRFPVLGVTYTGAMTIVFLYTHRHRGPQPAADSWFMVAALTAQVVLAIFLAVLAVLAFRRLR